MEDFFTGDTPFRRDIANAHCASEKARREINSTITVNGENHTAYNASNWVTEPGQYPQVHLYQHQESKNSLASNGNPHQTSTVGMWGEDDQW